MNTNLLKDLMFICFFHAVGGVAIGFALRQLRQRISANAFFFMIWGVVFGLAPLGTGIEMFQNAGMPFLVVIEVMVIVAAVATTYFIGSDLGQDLQSRDIGLILGGGVCLFIGLIAGLYVTTQNLLGGLLFLLAFGGGGIVMLVLGVQALLKEK